MICCCIFTKLLSGIISANLKGRCTLDFSATFTTYRFNLAIDPAFTIIRYASSSIYQQMFMQLSSDVSGRNDSVAFTRTDNRNESYHFILLIGGNDMENRLGQQVEASFFLMSKMIILQSHHLCIVLDFLLVQVNFFNAQTLQPLQPECQLFKDPIFA